MTLNDVPVHVFKYSISREMSRILCRMDLLRGLRKWTAMFVPKKLSPLSVNDHKCKS